MSISNRWVWSACLPGCLLGLLMLAVPSHGRDRAECEQQFKPQSGQPGKDVIWVPTNDRLVTRMLEMAEVKPTDLVYDLGAGDGKIAIAAAKQFGARAVGVEYNPDMARLGQCYAEAEGVADRVKIVQGDIFETDFTAATVVTLYLLPELNVRLRPAILQMKPGTRVVSHSFLMDDWEPDERSSTEDGQAYFWVVPAQAAGTWNFHEQGGKDRFSVKLDQTFQQLTGTAGKRRQPAEGHLRGSQIELTFDDSGTPVRLNGRVDGDRLDAKVQRGNKTSNYIATRAATER